MRFLVPLSARPMRRGLSAFAVALVALTTGCEFITGVPNVERVEVALVPDTIAVGQTSTATGTAYGDNNKVVTSSKVRVGYASNNNAVATVNAQSGQVVGVAVGTAVITGSARGKSGSKTIVVVPARVARVTITQNPATVTIGAPLRLEIQLYDAAGNQIPGTRPVTAVTPANPNLLSASGTNTGNVTLTGAAPGGTSVTMIIEGLTVTLPTTVQFTPPASMSLALQKNSTVVGEGETVALIPTLKDANGQVISAIGRTVSFTSSDETVLGVTASTQTGSGVVIGRRAGTATVTAVTDGNVRQTLSLTVAPVPVAIFQFASVNPVFRKAATRFANAVAYDSVGNRLTRTIVYRSSNPAVLQISTSGEVTPLEVGTATITATLDTMVRRIDARVTLMPVNPPTISPTFVQREQGQQVQFTATVIDSLNNIVTDRPVSWLSGALNIVRINATTGLATAVGPGSTGISAQIERVPGEGPILSSAASTFSVVPTPIDTITVSQTSVTVRIGQSTAISLVPRDAQGNQLFGRASSITVTVADAAVVQADAVGNITGRAAGTTTITYQAVDSSLLPQGRPSRVTVTVTP